MIHNPESHQSSRRFLDGDRPIGPTEWRGFEVQPTVLFWRQPDGAFVEERMADTLTTAERSRRMSRIRCKDTAPEMTVRRIVHRLGYRYRLHRKDLPGRPDLVFPRLRSVIFVHGCFWHRHPDPNCRLARLPKSRLDFWEPKLTANRGRDLCIQDALTADGWRVLVVWECELRHKEQLENALKNFLEQSCGQSSFSRGPEG
jgi:DNA mismatch endonuclease (patch repair protein)